MNFPKIFSLSKEYVPEFDEHIPKEDYNWSAKIRIKEHKQDLILYGTQKEPYIISPKIGKKTLPLFKSNLQKCVRRKDEGRSIRTALAIFSYSPSELLRRLPIIMIEDTLIHPKSLIRLVWYMCAVSKGFVLSKEELSWVLGVVSAMCENDTYDAFNSRCKKTKDVDWSKLPYEQQKFFWALELRKFYGGMWVDKQMIEYHEELWKERFSSDALSGWFDKIQNQPEYEVDIDLLDSNVDKDDVLLSAIDYHPYPFLVRKMIEKYPTLSADEIRISIWMCRSRINDRTPIDLTKFRESGNNIKNIFEIFREDLEGFTGWLRYRLDFTD